MNEGEDMSLSAVNGVTNSLFASLATPSKPSPAQRALALFPLTPTSTQASPTLRKGEYSMQGDIEISSSKKDHDEACYIDCERRFDMVGALPIEIAAYIFTFLHDYRDLIASSSVSRTWFEYARSNRVWHQLFLDRSDEGWAVLPNADKLWTTSLPPAYDALWNAEDEDETNYLNSMEVSKNTSQRSVSERLNSLFRQNEEKSVSEEEAPIISPAQRDVLVGPMNWFYLYKAKFVLTQRWGLPVRTALPLSQTEADQAEEDELLSDDPANEYLEEYLDDPAAAAHLHAILRTREGRRATPTSTFQTSDKLQPAVKYLSGHLDSIYCVRLDSRPLELQEDVKERLSERVTDSPLYDASTSLGLGSRGIVYSGSRDRTIKIWDGDSGLLLHTLTGHQGSVLCLEFDESILMSGSSDKTVIIWDLQPLCLGEAPRQMIVLHGHAAGVLDIAMTERWVITCGKDATVRVYDRSENFACVHVYRQHRGPVNAGSISVYDAKVCAVTASGEGSIQLWEVETGTLIRTFEGHTKGLACVKFCENLVVSGSNDFTVRVWDADSGACLAVCRDHRDLVRAVAFDAKRKLVVSAGYDGRIKLFDVSRLVHPDAAVVEGGMTITALADVAPLEQDVQRHVPGAGRVFDVQIDASRIVSCGENNRICIRDFASDSPIMRLFV